MSGREQDDEAEVEELVRLLDEGFAEPFSLSDFCRERNLSVRTLTRRFRRVTGETPKAYQIARRIQWAAELLSRTDHRVVEIALLTGYWDHAAFTRAFRARMGIAPAGYRARGRQR